ncbi:MAG: hypothetical protein PHT96_06165 [Syntrophorhabdaceae bacterium]|nr:hypothetical protein [Syntrophorhabdaceae bacterium]
MSQERRVIDIPQSDRPGTNFVKGLEIVVDALPVVKTGRNAQRR